MSRTIKLKKGFDINLKGKAKTEVVEGVLPDTYALKPDDFQGINRPKLLVKEGDNVKAGTPMMYDKMNDKVMFCAPVSGEVVEIKRGEKRKILELKILADKEVEYETFEKFSISDLDSLDPEKAKELISKSGVWPNIVQRPFGTIANPDETPRSIHISAFDSSPLAPDYDFIFKGDEDYFQAGIDVLNKLTDGKTHLGLDGRKEVSKVFAHAKNVEITKFTGKHPIGNVGIQIHHTQPINKGDMVWTVSPSGVVQIGKLFLEGKYDATKIVALAGSEVKNPQYYKTYNGACVNKMLENNMASDQVRVVSGNVLSGTKIDKNGFLGFYDQLISVIPEGDYYEMFGWILPSFDKLSFQRAFGLFSWLNPGKKEYVVDSNTHGEKRAFVQSGVFEKVMPMDIYPTHLLKAILAEDFDEMEALGIYEVIEEDMALCEFVDVSKHNVQSILRDGLELLRNS
ncbi:MAG TPA: NADH:ubiquinone reductase (Na(+)-transporting) subunit A [Flavobacteriales bacterium]|jgi:Na+-transporting NADH:ubiquinone oxidoreductase subunit A|nr:NADH:ubiquinone reductase (Na(+)-transporting) subunit A [Flavobacteriales bacterium]